MPSIRIRVFLQQRSGYRMQTGVCLAAADSGLEAREALKEGFSALTEHILELNGQDLLSRGRRKPHIRSEDGADPEEPLRSNANHGEWGSVDLKRLADYVRRAVEAVFPDAVAQHGNRRGPWHADLTGKKESTFRGCEAQRFKVAVCHKLSEEALLFFAFDQSHRHRRREPGESAEYGVSGLVVLEIQIRNRKEIAGLPLTLQVCRVGGDKAGWILSRERMEQQTVHYREHSRAGADAQPQCQNGEEGKGRRSGHTPKSIYEVAQKIRKQNSRAQSFDRGRALAVTALGPGQRNGELTTP